MLDTRARQECRQPVEVVLGEVFQRVVVALGALEPLSQEQAGDGWDRLLDFELLEHEVDRRMPEVAGRAHRRVALRREHGAHRLVVGPVLADRVVQPALERAVGAALGVVLGIAEPVLELHQPVGGVLVTVQQPIHEGGAFVGAVARKKGLGLVCRGQDADSVQVHPAQEGAVVAERKRLDTDAAELVEDMLVDEIDGLREPQIAARRLLDDDELCRGCLAHCAGHDGCHARCLRGDGPIAVQCHDGLVLDGVADFCGQIARRAVGQPAHHDDGLALARAGQHPLARMDLESL